MAQYKDFDLDIVKVTDSAMRKELNLELPASACVLLVALPVL